MAVATLAISEPVPAQLPSIAIILSYPRVWYLRLTRVEFKLVHNPLGLLCMLHQPQIVLLFVNLVVGHTDNLAVECEVPLVLLRQGYFMLKPLAGKLEPRFTLLSAVSRLMVGWGVEGRGWLDVQADWLLWRLLIIGEEASQFAFLGLDRVLEGHIEN